MQFPNRTLLDSFTFSTKPPTYIINSFSFGPDYGSYLAVTLQTSITNDSTGDISLQVVDFGNDPIASKDFSLDVSDDTEVNLYYLDEKSVSTVYSEDIELVIQKHFLELAITTNDGTRSWNVNGSGITNHVIEPFRQLVLNPDPDAIFIRAKQDGSTDILDRSTTVFSETLSFGYMQERFILTKKTIPYGDGQRPRALPFGRLNVNTLG